MSSEPAVSSVDGVDAVTARTAAVSRWVADWAWWRSSRPAAAAIERWRLRHPWLDGCRTADAVVAACGRDRSVGQDVADARLAGMVAEATAGDRDAARVVLQRVLPGLVARAGRRSRQTGRPLADVLDELVAAAWVVISEYPLARRPAKVAVNILMDAEHHLFGYVPAMVRATVPVEPQLLAAAAAGLDGRAEHAGAGAGPELLELLAEAVGRGLPASDARLLAELVVLGLTPEQVGARDGLSGRAIRRRRQQAVRRLAACASAALTGAA